MGTLVALQTATPSGGTQSVSYPDYVDGASASHTLRDVVAYRQQQLSLRLSPGGDARATWDVLASSNYFSTLDVRPALGRFFRPDESAPGAKAGSAPVAVISYDMWQRDFAARSDALGQPVRVNGHRLTVIGVAPRGFHGSNVGFGFEFWAPITMEPTLLSEPTAKLTYRNSRWVRAFARLASGTSITAARQEMKQIGRALAAEHVEDKNVEPSVMPLLDAEASAVLRPTFVALLGSTVLLLLVVAFNMVGLGLVRAAGRRDELAIRAALGASRARIVQNFVAEAALVGLVSIPAALGVAVLGHSLLDHFLEDQISGALMLQRLAATLLSIIGALALIVATLGLYGTLAESVELRRSEIGIRMALGAAATDVVRQFAAHGLMIAVVGMAIGAPAFFVAAWLLRGQLYQVGGPIDLTALAITAGLFAAVAAVASIVTAWRAGRVDPVGAMRSE